jgi:RHS repeat-associated protein
LQATGGGTVSDGVLTSLSGVNLTIDGSSTIATAQLTSYAGGSISISGGSPSFAGLTSFNGSDITVSGGGTVSLPGVTGYAGNGNTTTLEATGTGSALTLANLASVTEAASNYPAATQFEALAGGTVTLSGLHTINTGTVVLESDGAGSVLNVSALTGFAEANGWTTSTLQASNGGTVDDGSLATLSNVNVDIIGTAEKLTLNSLTSYGGGNITVSAGATLSLPGLTGYAGNGGTTTLEATGTGSVLTLANLATITESASNYPAASQFEALAGGTVNLPALKMINTGTAVLESDGANSSLNISALTGFSEANGWTTSTLQATGGGAVNDGALTRLSGVNLTIDGSSTIATAQLSSFVGGSISIDGGSPRFSGLTSFNGSDITVSGGGTVSLPAVTGYTGNGNTTTLEATGAGSTLTLPNLATVTEGANNYPAATQFEALAGGSLTLPALKTINTGTVVLESDGTNSLLDLPALTLFDEVNGWTASVLQDSNGGTLIDPSLSGLSGVNLVGDATGTFTITASLGLTITGGTTNVQVGTLVDQGDLSIQNGATLNLQGGLTVNGAGVLTAASGSTIEISGNLLGNTQNADDFVPMGTVELNSGLGTSKPPQELEAMSADLGATQAGFVNNFAYDTISLTANTSVELVDQSTNTTSGKPEAVYADELIVPAGATLNLNNLHLYVRGDQVSGTVVGGTITAVPSGGSIALNTPTPATLTPAGAIDNWTFYGTAGESITIQLNPGGGGSNPAISPTLNWGQVALLSSGGSSLATASSASSGAIATISGLTLPANGTYTIQVQAAQGQSSSSGNYVLSAYNVTANVQNLTLNQRENGTIRNPYGLDQWVFTGSAGQQVQLVAVSASGGVQFDLNGPGNQTLFSDLQADSGLITLPASGQYVLTAHGSGGQGGAYAFALDQTSVTNLTLGGSDSGTLAGSGQAQLFEVTVPATQSLIVGLQDNTATDVVQLFANLGSPPTPFNYGESSGAGSSDPKLLVPSAAPGTWYILVYAASVSSSSPFTIQATGAQVQLSTVAPDRSATGSPATLTLTGSGFDGTTTVSLISASNQVYMASTVSFDTPTQLTATFSLSGVPQGVYSVEVTRAGDVTSTLPGAFTVLAQGSAQLETHLILPSEMGRHVSSTIYVEYSNTGSVAMPAPLLVLYAPPEVIDGQTIVNLPLLTLDPSLVVSGYWTSALPAGYSNSVQILASGKVPGWLEPGESVTVPVYYAGMQQPWSFAESSFDFKLDYYTQQDKTPADWSSLGSSLQPPGISGTAWSAIYAGLSAQLGNTWGGYVKMLDDEANYLGQLGEDVTDVNSLWAMAVTQADGLSPATELDSSIDLSVTVPGTVSLEFDRLYQPAISSRDATGPLGFGWTDNWQYSLSVASDGTVTVDMPGGEQRIFQPDSRPGGGYFAEPGDQGILTADAGGAFTLQESDGQIETFNADGTLDYIQDTDGNRITAGYTGGRLTSLTDNSEGSLAITYNAAGLIATVASADGRTVSYTYDSTDHLIGVQEYSGATTQYTYDASSNPSIQNALTSIAFTDGTHQYFTYNTQGQLTGVSSDGGAQPLTFQYNEGEVTVTDAAGDSAEYYYNEQAEVVKYVDPLGNSWFGTYDSTGDLTSLEAPTGLTQTFTYDSQGNVISTTDPLGQTTTFSYTGPYNSLSSVTNAAGQTTSLSYDANGDLTSVENADDSVSTATYDALGDPLTLTNANGQATSYTYNAAGQVASVTLSDGTTTTYAYDSHGNLTTATDAAGVTTLTYNSADLLTGVSYPTGLSLQYTYDAGGRRTQMVELSGSTVTYTVNYSYTASGQLSRLTDGSGNLIIAYTYNTQGELTREDKGDGTYTTYTYDAEGNILDLVNDSAGGQVDSSFAYTYNALGEVTTMVTVDGTWTYSYDSDEQLIHAAFASTNSQIPSQDLTYVYNAAGDRVQTIVNGVTTNDTSNSVNEYTTVGGTTYGYDASGNLISETNSSGTTTFAYDSENRLISETSGSNSWIYEYDALGNLSATIYDGQTTTDLVDPIGAGNLVAQFSGTGSTNPIASYTYGLGLVSQVTPGGTNYYQFDALGSTAGLTNQASGLVATYQYSPFGGVLSSTGALANPFTFVGEYGVTSAGNGLYDMRARSYDPSTGSFISEDPLRIQPTFAYAANNPVSTIDATGLSSATPPQVIHFNDPNYDSGYYISQPWGNYPGNSILINDYYANAVPHWGDITYYHEYSHWYYENVLNPGALHGGTQDELYAHSKSAEYAKKMGWEDARRAEQRFVDQILKTKRPPVSRVSGIILKLSAHLPPPPPPVTVVCVPLPTSDTGYSFDTSGATMCNPSSGSSGGGGAGTAGAYDPNSLQGPSGYGPSNYVPGTAKAMFPYQIDFENAPTATAPAQQVTVTEILDPNLDLSTFQWTGIGWGDTTIAIPPGTQDYRTTVPMTYNGVTFDVVVNATLDVATRELTVTFQSIDPATSLPPNLLTGFLPPEDGTGRGEGYVSYLIAPNAGLATGTAIRSVANIVFDGNPAIATDQVSDTDPSQGTDPTKQALITIDNTRPTSSVNPLPAVEDSTSFTVSWGGSDGNGSGIQFYDIVYSDDGGTPQTWQSMTTQTSAVFTGQAGHTYTFYSVAYSNTAFLQQVPATPQAQTTIAATAVPSPTPSPTTPSPTPSPTSPSPTPSPTTPSPTPSSTSTSVPPTIIGEQALFTRKLNQKHKPVGKPTLAGFELQFSSAMNAATAGNAGNYQVAWSSTKRVKKKLTTLLHPVPFSAQYDAATHSVSLILTGKQAFAQGGQITVIATPPDGVSGDTGVLLDGGDSGVAGDNGVFTIQKGGKGITGP